jgi:hypothetical protein
MFITQPGEVAEWFKATVLKTVVGQLTASSNLALSAKYLTPTEGCTQVASA